jgi:hypothetical protein
MTNRLLRDTQGNLEVTFSSGSTTQDADGAVTVDILRADGTALATDGATTHQGGGNSGRYRYLLAPQANLDVLTTIWEGTFGGVVQRITRVFELVGGFYVTLPEIRAADSEFTDAARYPDDRLGAARAWFEDKAEEVCGVAFVPRYGRELHDGDATDSVMLRTRRPRKLLAATLDGVALVLADLKVYSHGEVRRKDGAAFTLGDQNVVLAFEHGYDAPDSDLREAALEAIRHRLLATKTRGVPDRAVTMTTESGASFTLGLAGPSRPTGIPEVDAVILAKRENRVGVR